MALMTEFPVEHRASRLFIITVDKKPEKFIDHETQFTMSNAAILLNKENMMLVKETTVMKDDSSLPSHVYFVYMWDYNLYVQLATNFAISVKQMQISTMECQIIKQLS